MEQKKWRNGVIDMRYNKGEITVGGNPSIAWIKKMAKLGMSFTLKNGKVIAYFEKENSHEEIQI